MKVRSLLALLAVTFLWACNGDDPVQHKPVAPKKPKVETPAFSADSAYRFIEEQVAFGPRVPNTEAHAQTADYLAEKLRGYGAEVIVQEGTVYAWDDTPLGMKNIIGQFQPEKKKRLLLYAHWDTRPYADKDSTRAEEPIDGANDGGSGVGVLLEAARQLGAKAPEVGVDIIFFDTEDYGAPEWVEDSDFRDWCLGSQYWAENKHKPGYRAKYGILLDMVGGKNAVFNREGTSMALAPSVVDKVWRTARNLGYSDLFQDEVTPQTIDDNYFVTDIAGIPSANIVEYHIDVIPMGYGKFHHTHLDDMSIISKETLQAVGDVVMEVVYQE